MKKEQPVPVEVNWWRLILIVVGFVVTTIYCMVKLI